MTTTHKKADANNKYRVWAWSRLSPRQLPISLGRARASTFRLACARLLASRPAYDAHTNTLASAQLYAYRAQAMEDRARLVAPQPRRRHYIWAPDSPTPTLLGRVTASTFELACAKSYAGHPFYNAHTNTLFGARLYPSYKAARSAT